MIKPIDNCSNGSPTRILFLPNWKVARLKVDRTDLQPPDKYIEGQGYWFFRHFSKYPEVTVLDFQGNGIFHFIERRIGLYITQSIKAFLICKQYDVVMSHGAQSGLVYSLLNRLPGKRKRPKHIIVDIGGMNGGREGAVECTLVRQALASSPSIICHSSSLLEFYKKTYPSVYKSAVFIPFGVDTEEFKPENTNIEKQVLSFGFAKRDYATLLSAWERISTDAGLKIIGSKISRNLKNVTFMDGVSLPELKREIAQSLFVVIPLPYFNYSYGQMSFLQSMSMGKPVIVTQTPSSIDYLKVGHGSLSVPVADPESLAEKISYYLNNDEIRVEQAKAAREYVEATHSERIMASKFEQLIGALHCTGSSNE